MDSTSGLNTLEVLRDITRHQNSFSQESLDDNTASPTVGRLIDLLLRDYSSDLRTVLRDLDISGYSSETSSICAGPEYQVQEVIRSLERCSVLVLSSSKINWGRVLVILTLFVESHCRWMIRGDLNTDVKSEMATNLVEEFSAFLDERIGDWVASHGGWTYLISSGSAVPSTKTTTTPSDVPSDKNCIYSYLSYAVMGVGIGTLLGLMVVR